MMIYSRALALAADKDFRLWHSLAKGRSPTPSTLAAETDAMKPAGAWGTSVHLASTESMHCTYVYLHPEGHYGTIRSPKLMGSGVDEAMVIGNASESLEPCSQCVGFRWQTFQAGIITLVPAKADHDAFHLVDGLAEELRAPGGTPDAPIDNTVARLDFDIEDDVAPDDAPRIAAMCLFFPLPPDCPSYCAELRASDPDIKTTLATLEFPAHSEPYKTWIIATAHLYQNDNRKSLTHAHSKYFHQEALTEALEATPNIQDSGSRWSTHCTALPCDETILFAHQGSYQKHYNNMFRASMLEWFSLQPESRSNSSAPVASTGQEGTAINPPPHPSARVLPGHGIALGATLEEQEQVRARSATNLQYALLGGHWSRTVGPNNERTFVLGELTPRGKIFFSKLKCTSDTSVTFQRAFKTHRVAVRAKRDAYSACITTEPKEFTHAKVNAIHSFNFASDSLAETILSNGMMDVNLTVCHFSKIPPATYGPPGTSGTTTTGDSELLHRTQEQMGESPRHMAKKTTNLVYLGSMCSKDDLLSCLANLFCLLSMLLVDFENSILWSSILQPFFDTISDADKWFCTFRHSKYLCLNILEQIQSLFAGFVTLSLDDTLLLQAQNNEPINPTHHTTLCDRRMTCISKLQAAIACVQIHEFGAYSPAFDVFFPPPPGGGTKRKRDHQQAPATPSDPRPPHPSGPPRHPAQVPPALDGPALEKKELSLKEGLFVATSGKRIPFINCFFPGQRRACILGSTRNRACISPNCSRVHVLSWSDLPDEATKAAVIAHVTKNKDIITFSPGNPPKSDHSPFTAIWGTANNPPITPWKRPTIHTDDSLLLRNSNVIPKASPVAVVVHPPPTHPGTSAARPISMPDETPPQFTKEAQAKFLASLPTAVQAHLEQPFGKNSPCHSFSGDLRLRHVLVFLFPSTKAERSFLTREDRARLCRAYPLAITLCKQIRTLRKVHFSPVRGFETYRHHESETELDQNRITMLSAALLHFRFDVAALVRWLGGPHTGSERDVPAIMQRLSVSVDQEVLTHLRRIYTIGAPRQCHAKSSEQNLLEYHRYGNHKSVTSNPKIAHDTLVKDFRRGSVLVTDIQLLPFIPHLHLTPQGIVNANDPWKKARPIFDSSFRPTPTCTGINDWFKKDGEIELAFPDTYKNHLRHIWNLRITYPNEPILLLSNDIGGAFRLVKYHPSLVSMHGSTWLGRFLCFSTGMTFGDSTSPQSFEPIPIARSQHAQYLFQHEPLQTLQKMKELGLPPLIRSKQEANQRAYPPANRDSHNPGVLDSDGQRLPPPFGHWVDDQVMADIPEFIALTDAASCVSLLEVCGKKHPCLPPTLHPGKLQRQLLEHSDDLGRHTNARTMEVGLPIMKQRKLLALLTEALGWETYTIRQLANLNGELGFATEYSRWGRIQLMMLQNSLRKSLLERFHVVKRITKPAIITAALKRKLPVEFHFRIASLVSREIAQVLWNPNVKFTPTDDFRFFIHRFRDYLLSTKNPWPTPIGHIVPRDPAMHCATDASRHGIGIMLPFFKVYCIIPLSKAMIKRAALSHNHREYIHINALEFIGTLLAYLLTGFLLELDPSRCPSTPFPILAAATDNTTSLAWGNKNSTKSRHGQQGLRVLDVPAATRNRILEDLSTKPGAALSNALDSVLGFTHRAGRSPKEFRVRRNQQLHFLQFSRNLDILDRLIPQVKLTTETLNHLCGMYCAYLGSSHSISCRSIKAGTISNYLRSATRFIQAFDPVQNRDARKVTFQATKLAPCVEAVLDEIKRFEKVPNKREPYTLAMQATLQASADKDQNPDSLTVTLADWGIILLLLGCRRSEWAQTNPQYGRWDRNIFGDPTAFCLQDLELFGPNRRNITHREAGAASSPQHLLRLLASARLRFQTQKNSHHGEKRRIQRNEEKPELCPIRKLANIFFRFAQHFPSLPPNVPLALYAPNPSNPPLWITARNVETTLQTLARDTYNITDPASLSLFSSHSYRVGACVILHSMGHNTLDLQFMLRWRSLTFFEYLRNTPILSSRQTRTLNQYSDAERLDFSMDNIAH